MTWLFGLIVIPLLLCFFVGAGLSTAWWLWRNRSIRAEYEKRRLTAEAESDRLRLRVSSLQAADARADHLQLELEKAKTETVRMPKVEGELKNLRLQAELVPELENQIANLRAKADRVDHLERQLAELERTNTSAAERPDTPATAPIVEEDAVIDLRTSEPDGQESEYDGSGLGENKSADTGSRRDDLQVIRGIGPKMERTLNAEGITTWEQLAAMTGAEIEQVSEAIGNFRDRIERDRWVEQAAELVQRYPLSVPYDRPTKSSRPQQK